jgi:hypothetical protein
MIYGVTVFEDEAKSVFLFDLQLDAGKNNESG